MAAAEAAAQAERAADAALAAWGSPPAAEALRGALESAEAAARGALATKTVDGSLGVLAASAAAASARAEASAGAAAADAGVAEEMRVLLARLAVDGGVSAAQRGAASDALAEAAVDSSSPPFNICDRRACTTAYAAAMQTTEPNILRACDQAGAALADILARRLPDRCLPDAVELVARAHPRRLQLGQSGESGRGADADARLVD